MEKIEREDLQHAPNDTTFMSFEVAPFTDNLEFLDILTNWFAKERASYTIGLVRHAKKKNCPKFYIVAEILDEELGNNIIASLSDKTYCNIPLNPCWIAATTWQHFYTLFTKQAAHSSLSMIARSTTIQRIKSECPTSHHQQLDELLCSTADEFKIIETYQSWFGESSFSPFGTITPSTF